MDWSSSKAISWVGLDHTTPILPTEKIGFLWVDSPVLMLSRMFIWLCHESMQCITFAREVGRCVVEDILRRNVPAIICNQLVYKLSP